MHLRKPNASSSGGIKQISPNKCYMFRRKFDSFRFQLLPDAKRVSKENVNVEEKDLLSGITKHSKMKLRKTEKKKSLESYSNWMTR